jgi:hypothetical protein
LSRAFQRTIGWRKIFHRVRRRVMNAERNSVIAARERQRSKLVFSVPQMRHGSIHLLAVRERKTSFLSGLIFKEHQSVFV